MGVSRVDFAGETLVDLTGDTVTPKSLLSGYSAHNKAGELIEGLAVIPTVGNGTVTIKQNGASKGTFTMNQSGNTTIELTDNNTTYGAATQSANGLMTSADKKKLDGLTSTTSLAVTQQGTSVLDGTVGKVLDDKITAINSKLYEFRILEGIANENIGFSTELNYPSGYTMDNTIIISSQIFSSGGWDDDTVIHDQGNYYKSGIRCHFKIDKIQVTTLHNLVKNCRFKILIMKY